MRYLNWHETDLGILCILGSQVLVKIPNDVWCDLERAEEHEEQAEEDVQAADDQTLTHDLLFSSSPCKGSNRIIFLVDKIGSENYRQAAY